MRNMCCRRKHTCSDQNNADKEVHSLRILLTLFRLGKWGEESLWLILWSEHSERSTERDDGIWIFGLVVGREFNDFERIFQAVHPTTIPFCCFALLGLEFWTSTMCNVVGRLRKRSRISSKNVLKNYGTKEVGIWVCPISEIIELKNLKLLQDVVQTLMMLVDHRPGCLAQNNKKNQLFISTALPTTWLMFLDQSYWSLRNRSTQLSKLTFSSSFTFSKFRTLYDHIQINYSR